MEAPPPICDVIYVLIAFCVGTILSLLAANDPSVLNSLIVAPVDPNATDPSDNSCRPLILNASAFRVATPVLCSTVNNPPTLKLPSWSVEVKNTLPPPPSTASFAGIGFCVGKPG